MQITVCIQGLFSGFVTVVRWKVVNIFITFCFVVDNVKCTVVTPHARQSVCSSVRGHMPTLLHDLDVTWGSGRGCPLVVHSLLGGFAISARVTVRCYDNIMRTRNVSDRSMPSSY